MNNINNICYFSCLNYKNDERKKQMEERFKNLNINCHFYQGVSFEDERLKNAGNSGRIISCMYGHLDMICNFYYKTDKEYGIFCEDDIFIDKLLNIKLQDIINDVSIMNLDILLLGYLIPYKIEETYIDFRIKHNFIDKPYSYKYHNYPNDLWGSQMYLLTRKYAKYLLDTYYTDYYEKSLLDPTLTSFSADWIITKNGNRALIYPMVAVENGEYMSGHCGQDNFHKDCFNANITDNFI